MLFNIALFAQSGCPDCVVNVPDTLPEDTIYLSDAASGQVGRAYDSDLSFRMPKTTTPVAASDPTVVPGLNISQIDIVSVTNLPPGLSWEANQRVFDTSEETDGCVKFCGVPLQPGLYEVEVVVDAQVLVVTETTSFTLPILIEPAVVVTEGFTLENASGCGEVMASFTNNVPSDGQEGYAYAWDFGNGNVSNNENPPAQTYTAPGSYPIQYQAIIDTTGFFLTNVEVTDFDCDDFLGGRPDLQLEIYNPDAELIFQSEIVNNADAPVPFNLNIKLDTGAYALRVTDDDSGLGGGDDDCGTINFSRGDNDLDSLRNGDLGAAVTIIHPVDTIRSVDTVTVFEQPASPMVTGYEGEPLCAGDVVDLMSSYDERIQWFRDSVSVLEGGTNALLSVMESGKYWVRHTSADGCRAISDTINVQIAELPDNPIFLNANNFLEVIEEITLPEDFSAQWYLDGEAIPDATGTAFCATANGSYQLVVTNDETGCSNSFSRIVTFDPNFAGCSNVTATEEAFSELVTDVSIFPNPTNGLFWLDIQANQTTEVQVIIRNATGSVIAPRIRQNVIGVQRLQLDLSARPAGMYFLELRAGVFRKHYKVFKK